MNHSRRSWRIFLYDTRYRGYTIQALVFLAVVGALSFLAYNAAQNLEALGKPVSFGFLFDVAGYDINQRPIDYSATDTHLRAALVGLSNTLILAVLGCITATALGIFVGIMRLTPNWYLARLAATYVEVLRNVPVLLWIFVVYSIMIEAMSAPKLFRTGLAEMSLFDSVAITNRGIYLPSLQFENLTGAVRLFGEGPWRMSFDHAWLVFFATLIISVLGTLAIGKWSARQMVLTGRKPSTWWMKIGSLTLPVAICLWLLGAHFETPELKGFNFAGGLHLRNSFIALWLALSLYTSAFIAEAVRSGIQAVSRGQFEAAAALGLSPRQTMRLVILPQALRVIIPPTISQFLNLTKNTSLAIAVGYMDLTGTLMGITLNQTGREIETILLGMSFYLGLSLAISKFMNWYNTRMQLVER
jgi:general L-amino acid transport system permease protein